MESKRVEFFKLPMADKQAKVRLRFAYAGTDSWYFGIDNLAIYGGGGATRATLTIVKNGSNVTVSWTGGGANNRLEKTTSLNQPNWTQVVVPQGATSITEPIGVGPTFYRMVSQ